MLPGSDHCQLRVALTGDGRSVAYRVDSEARSAKQPGTDPLDIERRRQRQPGGGTQAEFRSRAERELALPERRSLLQAAAQGRQQLAVAPARWLGKPGRLHLAWGVAAGMQGVQAGRATRRLVRDLIMGAGMGGPDRRPVPVAQ